MDGNKSETSVNKSVVAIEACDDAVVIELTLEAAVKRAEKAEFDLRALKDAIRSARAAHEKIAGLVDGEQKKEQQYFNNFSNAPFSMDELFNVAKRVKGL